MLGVDVTDGNSYYLGLPSVLGHSKRVIFGFLKDRLRKLLSSWQSKLLSRAGKNILIKTVAQALPTYSMNVFLIPPSVLEELHKMLNSFWWGSRREGHWVIHWQRWERLCVRKEEGGLGLYDLRLFNLALLGKQGWNLLTKPHTLVARVFKEKYFPSGDYLSFNLGSNPSFVWKSIWSVKEVVKLGYRMRIGSGEITSVWNDPWVRHLPNFWVQSMIMQGLEDLKVSDLLLELGRRNEEFIHQILSPIEAPIVCGQLFSRSQEHGFPIWHHSSSGLYTVNLAMICYCP